MADVDRGIVVRPDPPVDLSIRCNSEDALVSGISATVALFYDWQPDPDALVAGLTRVLSDFPHFAAAPIQRDGELWLAPGPGVEVTVRDRDDTLAAFLARFDDPEARAGIASVVDPAGGPAFTVRLSRFADGGAALGLSWHHAIGDWATFTHLLRAWSRAVSGRPYDRPIVPLDRAAWLEQTLRDAPSAPTLRLLDADEERAYARYLEGEAQDRRMFNAHFGPEELEAIRAALQPDAGVRLSIGDALVAHLFTLVAERDPTPRERVLALTVNARQPFGVRPELAANFAGTVNLRVAPGAAAGPLAARIRGGIARYAQDHADFLANERFFAAHGGLARVDRFVTEAIDPLRGHLLVASWTGAGIAKVDFGRAPPFYQAGVGAVPIPWMSGIQEGPDAHGWVYTSMLPRGIVERLTDADGLAALHRYRREDLRPARALDWRWLS